MSYEVVFVRFVNGLLKHSKSINLSDGNLVPESLLHKCSTINFKICAIIGMSYCILVSKMLLEPALPILMPVVVGLLAGQLASKHFQQCKSEKLWNGMINTYLQHNFTQRKNTVSLALLQGQL